MTDQRPLGPVRAWFRRQFSDVEVLLLSGLLLAGLAILLIAGAVLAPVIAALVIAYLLDPAVEALRQRKVPRLVAVTVVWLLFVALLVILLLVLLPLLLGQVAALAQMLPGIVQELQARLLALPQQYPDLIAEDQAREMVQRLQAEILAIGQRVLGYSMALLPTLLTIGVYLILLPLVVFFFLKDKAVILGFVESLLPARRTLTVTVWQDANRQVGAYVRGKLYEIVIVAAASYPTFVILDLDFAALLAAATAVSVLVPYVGAAVAALPVALVGYAQWGVGDQLAWAMLAYAVIQALDGNVLAPLLLAETMNLHPITIIVAILVFGAIWGFWGVFFAAPLAALVQSVFRAWPRQHGGHHDTPTTPGTHREP